MSFRLQCFRVVTFAFELVSLPKVLWFYVFPSSQAARTQTAAAKQPLPVHGLGASGSDLESGCFGKKVVSKNRGTAIYTLFIIILDIGIPKRYP